MFSVTNLKTGKSTDVNFDQLCRLAEEDLDEAFYTEVFTAHTLTGRNGRIVIMGGHHD